MGTSKDGMASAIAVKMRKGANGATGRGYETHCEIARKRQRRYTLLSSCTASGIPTMGASFTFGVFLCSFYIDALYLER